MAQSSIADPHCEREFKWGLSHADFQRCRTHARQQWGPGQLLRQDNRFFDSADGKLRRHGMSIRLRRENHGLLLTCKRRLSSDQALHRQEEHETWLNTALWWAVADAPQCDASCLPLPAPVRQLVGDEPLVNLGGFANERLQWQRADELICLDHSRFSAAYEDWEIEIEIAASTSDHRLRESQWREQLDAWGVTPLPQERSKLQRFIEGREGAGH